jgi:flagellar assembly protein FliH
MAATAKYLFDLDFGSGSTDAKAAVQLAEHKAGLEEAEATGYRKGFAEAEAEARADSSRLTAAALERIAAVFEHVDEALRAVEAKLEAEAIEVAVAVGRKLSAALIEREPFAEIAALTSECFRQLVAAPHVVVRVNDALYAATRDKLDDILRARGFEGRLVVLAEAEIAPGDCRIEWADGGLNRNRGAAEATIANAVNRYLTARGNAASPHGISERSAR